MKHVMLAVPFGLLASSAVAEDPCNLRLQFTQSAMQAHKMAVQKEVVQKALGGDPALSAMVDEVWSYDRENPSLLSLPLAQYLLCKKEVPVAASPCEEYGDVLTTIIAYKHGGYSEETVLSALETTGYNFDRGTIGKVWETQSDEELSKLFFSEKASCNLMANLPKVSFCGQYRELADNLVTARNQKMSKAQARSLLSSDIPQLTNLVDVVWEYEPGHPALEMIPEAAYGRCMETYDPGG